MKRVLNFAKRVPVFKPAVVKLGSTKSSWILLSTIPTTNLNQYCPTLYNMNSQRMRMHTWARRIVSANGGTTSPCAPTSASTSATVPSASSTAPATTSATPSATTSEAHSSNDILPDLVIKNIYDGNAPVPKEFQKKVEGYHFSKPDESGSKVDYHALLESFKTSGFQATNFGLAVDQINLMLKARGEPIPKDAKRYHLSGASDRTLTNCTIFLGYTTGMISSGVRETIRFLVENNMVDTIVTSGGGVEEDFMKCFSPHLLGRFDISGERLVQMGINRIGNLLVPNSNYNVFQRWITEILDQMLKEQRNEGIIWSPSKMIARFGKEINNPESVYYWAYKNNIPVHCPAITDGAIGDMIFLHSYNNPGLIIDIAQDVKLIDSEAIKSINSGIILLGGGVVKHHICEANLLRNGADYAVFVNTAQEFDGSDAGARPDEAISWGKIKANSNPVKVHGDNSIIFPLLVAETFARNYKEPPTFSKS